MQRHAALLGRAALAWLALCAAATAATPRNKSPCCRPCSRLPSPHAAGHGLRTPAVACPWEPDRARAPANRADRFTRHSSRSLRLATGPFEVFWKCGARKHGRYFSAPPKQPERGSRDSSPS